MGTPAMALAIPRTNRETRSSTQSQTSRSRCAEQARFKYAGTTCTGRIEKHRTKLTDKSKKAAKSKSSPKSSKLEPRAKPKRSNEDEQEHAEPDSSIFTPENVTVFTVDSSLVKKPIICHQYAPSTPPPSSSTVGPLPFIFTHGAGGTLSAPAVVHFCTGFSSTSASPLLAFQGSMNLGARVKGFNACRAHLESHNGPPGDAAKPLVFGGRSMGARAAVTAATELYDEVQGKQGEDGASVGARLVSVSYPLQGPNGVRDQILLDLPRGVEVLFIVGDRDAMCPLELLEEVRGKMKAKTRVVVVRGADHGMNVKPAHKTKELAEETGRVAAKWLCGEVGNEGVTLYVGEGE
ncbi:hypothetical protein BU25DRAFT_408348 [Macroventuria anomochaeta]|uniref:Uncharacterized protein n=1 Tax=Macroventuria anomochaeta TaxID=301207 RepID=A0ACB6S8C4_9PLEO|nr:uncharacterized protein BU25DRAFT_408348 [Macroventuria anomochaeta]KAF2630401.1 hypothetical protein BU25DRAFT_408348 [Macroventuria anomochaeta]